MYCCFAVHSNHLNHAYMVQLEDAGELLKLIRYADENGEVLPRGMV